MDNILRIAESQYNLNDSTFKLIGILQEEATRFSHEHKYPSALDRWESIRTLIDARFTPKEKNKLNNLATKFCSQIPPIKVPKFNGGNLNYNPNQIYAQTKAYILNKKNLILKNRLKNYVDYLMILMRKYRIGATDKERKVKLT